MRTHPDDKLLEQHCYKSAVHRFVTTCAFLRVYIQLPEKYKNFDVSGKTHRLKVKAQVESLRLKRQSSPLRYVYTCNPCCDFLLLMDVNEWISYESSDEGTCTLEHS